jgi:hypothetical protein
MPVPRASLGPALNERGYYVGLSWPAKTRCRWLVLGQIAGAVPWKNLTNQDIKRKQST